MAKRFLIEAHDGVFKTFEIRDNKAQISIWIDYDDVNHPEVDAMARVIEDVLNAQFKYDTQKEKFKQYYKEELTKLFNETKYLQEEYESLEAYLEENL